MNENNLITLKEYAAMLRISRAGLYNRLNEGTVPAMFRIGAKRFIRRETVESFLREQEALAA